MRNSLGKVVIFLLALSTMDAEDFIYNLQIDNKNPYLKEATVVTLEINQTNPDIVLFFNFDIKKSNDYSFTRVDTIETDSYHNAIVKYSYLLYPLKDGHIDIEFNLLKKVTTDDNVAFSFSGDRDNVKGIVTTDSTIVIPPLKLNVKELPEDTLLIGDFTLTHTIKKHKAKAYEPLPFQVSIEGIGYPPLLNSILPKNEDFTKFSEEPIVKSKATLDETKNKIVYNMALSHSENFELAPIVIKAFNPKTESSYELKIDKQKFEIEKVDIEKLVDKHDSPAVLEQDWSWLSTFLSYIIVFIAGYLTAFSLKSIPKRTLIKEKNSLVLKIKSCKDEKELLQVLMANNNKFFSKIISKLENSIYKNSMINFKKVKQEAIEKL